jgi:hypothetical protein
MGLEFQFPPTILRIQIPLGHELRIFVMSLVLESQVAVFETALLMSQCIICRVVEPFFLGS